MNPAELLRTGWTHDLIVVARILLNSWRSTLELLVSPVEAARRLGIGRTRMFALIGSGEIKSVKVGRLRRVPVAALDDYVQRLCAAS